MAFDDTYHAEVLQSRRIRAQRAGFWAKIVSFALMILVIATFRSEPALRVALTEAAVGLVVSSDKPASPTGDWQRQLPPGTDLSALQSILQSRAAQQGQATEAAAREGHTQPRNGIKVNRFQQGETGNQPHFQRVPGSASGEAQGTPGAVQSDSTQRMADQIGALLKSMSSKN